MELLALAPDSRTAAWFDTLLSALDGQEAPELDSLGEQARVEMLTRMEELALQVPGNQLRLPEASPPQQRPTRRAAKRGLAGMHAWRWGLHCLVLCPLREDAGTV